MINSELQSTPLGVQPGVIRRKVGQFEVTAILDGFAQAPTDLLIGYDADKGASIRKSNFLPETGPFQMPISTYLVNTGSELILIDAGASEAWNENSGLLHKHLDLAGYKAEQVSKLLFTHLHPDHVLGAMDDAGNRLFPNAEFMVAEAEYQFWMDDGLMTPQRKGAFETARRAIKAYEQQITRIQGEEIAPGIQPAPLYGHTPGHTGYIISSGDESLFIVGDIAHMCALQFAQPDWSIMFDVDKDLARETRKKLLDQASTDRLLIAGMHLPFPGFGYVAREGDGYRFVPAPWQYS